MENNTWSPDRSKFKDERGSYITQSLFLEVGYDTDKAVYTFSDEDKEYKGVTYKSLRKLYLEECDPTEYNFAVKYLWGWEHWQRLCNNKLLLEEITKWREELEIKLRAMGVRNIIRQSGDAMVAAKWVADGLWDTARDKRTKSGKAKEKAIREKVDKAVEDDASRIIQFKGKAK
jgi:hypothetical protein